ncbi:MAG: PAS domain S-box protein, partial [Deltaproteobacteria bacterium]|nr:PAS domain S-box protein [Deltaproteobacteria bacterium]
YFQKFQVFAMNRMSPGVAIAKDSLTYWRVRILFAIVLTALMIGLFAFVPAVALAIKRKLWGLLLFDVAAWPIGFSVLLSRRLKYEIRAAIALIIFYALGLVIIISVGPLSGGPIWLFTFAVLVGVLLGSKAAIMALTANGITLAIIGWLISAGIFGQTFSFFSTREAMIAAGTNFMVLNTIAAISVAVLVKGLISTHQKEEALYGTLQKESLNLIEAKKKLEHEVDERLHAEEVLRESERLYRLLADNVNDNIWTMDMELKFTYVSPSVTRMRGYNVEEAMAQSIEEVITPTSLDIALKVITEELELHNKGQKPQDRSRKVEVELNCKDGSTIWTETESNFIYDGAGQPQSIIGVTRDITERRRTERALQFTQFAIDHFSDAAFWMENDGRFFYVNEASCNSLGYSREELLEMTVHDIDPDFPEEVWGDHWADLKSRGSFIIESHHRTKDGKVFPVELKVNHLKFGDNEYNCAFARNIFDRKQTERALQKSEEKLARSKKMESLGLLAGGVAHDLNNVLSGIVSYPELILMDLPEDSKLRKPIETIQES